jgi:hypothetical protein
VSDPDLTLYERVHRNPPNWKDWVGLTLAIIGSVITISIMLTQGGRILEALDNTRTELRQIVGVVTVLKDDMANMRTELVRQQGVDALHEANAKNLQVQLDAIKRDHR